MDTPQPSMTFIVKVHRTEAEAWIGVVERVATGEKRRWRSLDELGALIREMTHQTNR